MAILMKPEFIESKKDDGFFVTPVTTNHMEIYLTQEVHEGNFYTQIEHVLRQLDVNDKVTVYLGSYGGSCHGLIHLISAFKHTKAKEVIMQVVSPCYSAASTLALIGTKLVMEEHTFLMFHNYSSGTRGKGAELVKGVLESDAWIKKYFRDLHGPFLTDEEMDDLESDKDVYVHYNSNSLKSRLKRHFKGK